jgi:hypothetical protein
MYFALFIKNALENTRCSKKKNTKKIRHFLVGKHLIHSWGWKKLSHTLCQFSSLSVSCGMSVVFFLGTWFSSTNKTNRHDIAEIFFNVALNTTNLTLVLEFFLSLNSHYHLTWWRKSEDQEKTTDLLQVTDKLYHIIKCCIEYNISGDRHSLNR